jgi:hypothetical protein
MARYQSRLKKFKSQQSAANYGATLPHYHIHKALVNEFTVKAKVDPQNKSFQDALLYFSRAEVENKDREVKNVTTFRCAAHPLFRPKYDYYLTIDVGRLDDKGVRDEAAAEEGRYKKIVNGKWDMHGRLNANDLEDGLKTDIGFVLNAAETVNTVLRALGAKSVGTHTPHQTKQSFAADVLSPGGVRKPNAGTTSILRKDYIYEGHLVTVLTYATVKL